MKFLEVVESAKSLLYIGVVVVALFFMYNLFNKTNESNRIFQEKLITITDNSMKRQGIAANNVEVKMLKKEFEAEKSEILKAFEEQKKKTGEVLDELGQVKAKMNQTRTLRVASDKIYKKETQDPKRWYFFKKITVKNKDGENVPVAWAMFYPYQDPDKQWKYGTYAMKTDVNIIESQNTDDTFNRYAEVKVFGKDNKELPVKLTDLKWEKIELTEKKWNFWNPRLGFSFLGNTDSDIGFGLNLSFMSYGKTNRDMTWRFLTPGVGILNEDEYYFSFEPFSYNLGEQLPLIENMFIGPTLTYSDKFDTSYGIQFSVPF